jgi:hypothetical protein
MNFVYPCLSTIKDWLPKKDPNQSLGSPEVIERLVSAIDANPVASKRGCIQWDEVYTQKVHHSPSRF